jgi:hypothetical protein
MSTYKLLKYLKFINKTRILDNNQRSKLKFVQFKEERPLENTQI